MSKDVKVNGLIAIEIGVSLGAFLEGYDVTEILEALFSQVEYQDDIKQWCIDTFGAEEDYYG